jgi:hypothetical protein
MLHPPSRDFAARDLRDLVEKAVKGCEEQGYRGGVFTEDEFAFWLGKRIDHEGIDPRACRDLLASLGYVRPAAGTPECWVYTGGGKRGGLGR